MPFWRLYIIQRAHSREKLTDKKTKVKFVWIKFISLKNGFEYFEWSIKLHFSSLIFDELIQQTKSQFKLCYEDAGGVGTGGVGVVVGFSGEESIDLSLGGEGFVCGGVG